MTPSIDATLFRCIRCQETLKESARGLQCTSCNEYWPVSDGILHFGGSDYRPCVLTDIERQQVVQAAVAEGWDVAVHDVLRTIDPLVYRRAIDEYRAQWRFVLPLSSSDYVLDLSCAWGAITFNLAETCAVVVAADACSEHVRFVAERARQKQQTNIIALQLGLDRSLPFPARSFDAVVLLDALSWCSDAEVQRLILRRIRTVLRPGGSLLVADTNRLSAVRLAKWVRTGNPHTVKGYQRLLQSVGFRHFRVYALAPSHLEPFFILPLDRWTPLEYFLREIVGGQDFGMHFRYWSQRMAYRLIRGVVQRIPSRLFARITRPFVPSVAIVAQM